MKVETDLKAGNVVQDATRQAGEIVSQVSDFVSKANRQASDFTSGVANTTSSIWNSLTRSLGV